MKARETALKLKRFEMDEKARKLADLEQMIREFENIAHDLDRQVFAEEERTGIKDPKHFSYSTFAKSASQRRDNLRASIAELKGRLDAAQAEVEAAKAELERAAQEARAIPNARPRAAAAAWTVSRRRTPSADTRSAANIELNSAGGPWAARPRLFAAPSDRTQKR